RPREAHAAVGATETPPPSVKGNAMSRIRTIIVAAAIAATIVPAGSAVAATKARSIAPITPVVPGPITTTPGPTTTVPGPTTPDPTDTTLHALGANLPTGPRVAARAVRRAIPASVDLTPWAVPVGDQLGTESCVAWAYAYSMLGWYSRHNGFNGQ